MNLDVHSTLPPPTGERLGECMRKCLNVGSGNKPIPSTDQEEWLNLDGQALPGVDVVHDVRAGLPFPDAEFDRVLLDNVLEHIPHPFNIALINEIDRVLKVGGTCTIIVPRFPCPGSVQDPGHVSFYTERSALYWATGWDMPVGTPYGVLAGFTSHLVAEKIDRWGNPDEEEFLRFRLVKRLPLDLPERSR